MALTIGDLSPTELRRRLAQGRLRFHAGPFVAQLQSPFQSLANSLPGLYGGYPLADEDAIVDFSVRIHATSFFRRWLRPKLIADVEGPFPGAPMSEAHAQLLMEIGLNWVTATRPHPYLLFHAAVVERDGQAILMPGGSGYGKSTLCTSLVARGWRLFSDEFAMLNPENGLLYPYPRPISLKNASIDLVRADAPHLSLSPVVSDTPKGAIAYVRPPQDSLDRFLEPAPCRAILMPNFTANAAPRREPIAKPQAFLLLTASSVNYERFGEAGFHALTRLVDQADGHNLYYGDIAGAVDLVEKALA